MQTIGREWWMALAIVWATTAGAADIDAKLVKRKPTAQAAGQSADLRLLRQRVVNALALAENGDERDADRELTAVIAHPSFAALSPEERHAVLSKAAYVALDHDDPRARTLLLRAVEVSPDDADDWYRLSLVERDLKNYDAAALAFVHLCERWPELLVNADARHIYRLLDESDRGSEARLKLLQALFDARWEDPKSITDDVWYELALMRIERGETDPARAVIKRIVGPTALIWLRSDKRFDAVVNREAWAFNTGAAARRAVERMHEKVAARPARLDIQVELTSAMLSAGMFRELLATTDETLRAIAAAPAGRLPYEEMGYQVWLMNHRAIALRRMGRLEEAHEELRRASELTESDGQTNVSQVLNLGNFYCVLRRPEEALRTLERLRSEDLSDYGRLVEASVRQCAHQQKGEAEAADRALRYIREHVGDSHISLIEALLLAGRIEEAAGVLIDKLADPEHRREMLEWLQEGREADPLPGYRDSARNFRVLLRRDDVKAAVERVGRIEHHDVWISNAMD